MVKKIVVHEDIPYSVKNLVDQIRNNDELLSVLKEYIEVNEDD